MQAIRFVLPLLWEKLETMAGTPALEPELPKCFSRPKTLGTCKDPKQSADAWRLCKLGQWRAPAEAAAAAPEATHYFLGIQPLQRPCDVDRWRIRHKLLSSIRTPLLSRPLVLQGKQSKRPRGLQTPARRDCRDRWDWRHLSFGLAVGAQKCDLDGVAAMVEAKQHLNA